MAVEINGTMDGTLNIKRCYMPGITVADHCPKCSTPWERDMEDHYISYPRVGVPHDVRGHCQECGHQWPVMVILRVTVEPAP